MRKLLLGIPAAFLVLVGSYLGPDHPVLLDQQEQTQLRHEVKVTVKLIQVYVTDKKGNPVLDLSKDDFLILDEGKQQNITEFEKHVLSLPSQEEEAKPEAIETPAPPARGLMPRKFFLFFDFAFNNAIGIEKAKRAALHFIDTQIQPTDEVGVLSYSAIKSLMLHEYLTTDHDRVRDVVRAFGMKDIAGRAEDFEARLWALLKEENPKDASSSGFVFDPEQEGKQELDFLKKQRDEARLQANNFIRKMTDLAKALRYVPGHKSIVLLSSGVPYSLVGGIPPPKDSEFNPENSSPIKSETSYLSLQYEDMVKELGAANCTVYALDTLELRSNLDSNIQTRGTLTLQKMASGTGGKYFGNINSYERHLEKIQNITGCYYVLGYYVDDKWDGAYHKIKVEVTRPGYKVHAQKGYFNPKPFKEYNDLERMLHLVDLALSNEPLFQTPVRFPLAILPYSPDGKWNLCLATEIPLNKIQEILAGKVEIISIVFDEKENIVTLKREQRRKTEFAGENFSYVASFSLSPGLYKCRLVIRNLETGKGAVASATAFIQSQQIQH